MEEAVGAFAIWASIRLHNEERRRGDVGPSDLCMNSIILIRVVHL